MRVHGVMAGFAPAGDVQCFGGDCYALAFGVPAALMVLALCECSSTCNIRSRRRPLSSQSLDSDCTTLSFSEPEQCRARLSMIIDIQMLTDSDLTKSEI